MMKKAVFLVFALVCAMLCLSVSVCAESTAEALTAAQIAEMLANSDPVGLNPPYGRENFPQEYIEPLGGTLTLTEDVLYLPGKNGLDVRLTATYGSNDTKNSYYCASTRYEDFFEKDAFYYYYDDNGVQKTILIFPDKEEDITKLGGSFYVSKIPSNTYTDDDDKKFYRLSQFDMSEENILLTYAADMSTGWVTWDVNSKRCNTTTNSALMTFADMWRWNIPVMMDYIHLFKDDENEEYNYYSLNTALVNFDGEYCDVELSHRRKKTNGDVSRCDVDVEGFYGTYTGFYTNETIVDEGKSLSYFCSVTDSEGRTMYFTKDGFICAVEDRFGNMIRYGYEILSPSKKRLNSITDTYGRVVTIEYTDSSVIVYVDENGDGTKIKHTEFETICRNSSYDTNNRFVCDDDYTCNIIRYENNTAKETKTLNYVKRNQLWYWSTSAYKYDTAECNLVLSAVQPNGLETHYEYAEDSYSANDLKKITYSVLSRYDIDAQQELNRYNYAYTHGTKTVVTQPYTGKRDTYYGNTYVTSKVTLHLNDSYTEEYLYKILNGKRKLRLTKQIYSNAGTEGEERKVTTSFDDYYRPYIKTYDNNQERTYYYGESKLVESFFYCRQYGVYVKNEYILSEEGADFFTGRTIDAMIVSESTDGGSTYTEKHRVLYTYNADGTLASEVFDPEGVNRVTVYSYQYPEDGSVVVTATVQGVCDADGNAAPSVTTTTKTDMFGRLVQLTDGNGNVTHYEYDCMGRLTRQINADNTFCTYEYDTENRTTVFTDESGIRQKTVYDGFGNVKAVYKNTSAEAADVWAKVSEIEYDGICRPSATREYTSFEKWTETQYEYANFDNIGEVTVTDENGTELVHKSYEYNYADRMGSTVLVIEDHDRTNGGLYRRFTSVTVETDAKDGIAPPKVKQYINRRGLLCKQIRTDGEDEYISTYVYDYLGNVLEYKDEAAYAEYDVDN